MNKEKSQQVLPIQSILGPRVNGLYSMLLEAGFAAVIDEDDNENRFVTLLRDEGEPVTLLYRYMGDEQLMNYYLTVAAEVNVKGISKDALSMWLNSLKLSQVRSHGDDSLLVMAYLPEYGGISDTRSLLLFLREYCNELDSLSAIIGTI
ncbi:MAG: hypothetical protein K6E19_05595 [Lachnospiraceae bacterium]|nr:hypothetical protein [Lachnospiraceae bacterium]